MTLAELNGHLDLVQQLQKTEELIQGLWNAAVPGAQKLDGMPHASGVNDKVGVLGAEIADMETSPLPQGREQKWCTRGEISHPDQHWSAESPVI